MIRLERIMTAILVAILTPNLVFAGGSCDAFCGNTTDSIKNLIQDQRCKADSSCVKCVGESLGVSQVSSYCSAYQSTTKSKSKQTVSAILFDATAVVCLTSCFMTKSGFASAADQTLAKTCTGLGLANAAYDFVG
jgi:predicted alpha/beta-fold hydrolase